MWKEPLMTISYTTRYFATKETGSINLLNLGIYVLNLDTYVYVMEIVVEFPFLQDGIMSSNIVISSGTVWILRNVKLPAFFYGRITVVE